MGYVYVHKFSFKKKHVVVLLFRGKLWRETGAAREPPLVEGRLSQSASRLCHTADRVLPGPSPELWTATEAGDGRSRF